MNTYFAIIVSECIYNYLHASNPFSEQRYRNELLVDNEPVLFEILDTCSKVS